jgi:hypothetical protein
MPQSFSSCCSIKNRAAHRQRSWLSGIMYQREYAYHEHLDKPLGVIFLPLPWARKKVFETRSRHAYNDLFSKGRA